MIGALSRTASRFLSRLLIGDPPADHERPEPVVHASDIFICTIGRASVTVTPNRMAVLARDLADPETYDRVSELADYHLGTHRTVQIDPYVYFKRA